jgi:glutamine synthetase
MSSHQYCNKTTIEYIWIGTDHKIHGKKRVMDKNYFKNQPNKLPPDWNYDGSSTGQADGVTSEIIIKPKFICPNPLPFGPFRPSGSKWQHKIVMCDTYFPNGKPTPTNYRMWANDIMNRKIVQTEKPWFGLEQEYFITELETGKPIGWSVGLKQGGHYCSVGGLSIHAMEKSISEEHLEACIYAGLDISGVNSEVAVGQWEFQIGPCLGIAEGDQLWVARYLLDRIAESKGYGINYEPKPLTISNGDGDWNGSGCHANYSTKSMREGSDVSSFLKKPRVNGLTHINKAIVRLETRHQEHMDAYGKGNEDRMTGECETASFTTFTSGVANRGASIRIGNETFNDKKGYFEDRRPSSNCDPYRVTGMIVETTLL